MNKPTYLKLDFDGIIYPQFPQSVKAITDWFCSREDIVEGLIGIDGGAATHPEIKAILVQIVPVIIQNDPRKLYEFFDDRKIFISVTTYVSAEGEVGFNYYVFNAPYSDSAKTRIEAEERAFLKAFAVLEKELQGKGGVNEERKVSINS